MSQLPWVKWYPADWSSEPSLSLCDAASRGIWADAVNAMLLQDTDRISGTIEQLCRLCRCRTAQMEVAIAEFRQFNVCEILAKDDSITLASRRLVRQHEISNLRREAGSKGLAKRHGIVLANSASASASVSPEGIVKGSNGKLTDDDFWAELVPLYPGVDLKAEHRKMSAWLLTPRGSGRKLTRRFVVHWLNRLDAEMKPAPRRDNSPNI